MANPFQMAEEVITTFRGPAQRFRDAEPVYGWVKELRAHDPTENALMVQLINLAIVRAIQQDGTGRLRDAGLQSDYDDDRSMLLVFADKPLSIFPGHYVAKQLTTMRANMVGRQGWEHDPANRVYRSRMSPLFQDCPVDCGIGKQNVLESLAYGLFVAMGEGDKVRMEQDNHGKYTLIVPEDVFDRYRAQYSVGRSPENN